MTACAQICKCVLFVFNGLFALLGLGCLALGLWLRFGADTKGFFNIDLNSTQFTIGVTVLVLTGVLMLLVAVVGDYGACNQNKSALGLFICLVSFLVTLEIIAGVMAFMWSGQVADQLANFYITIYTQYLNTRFPAQAITLKFFHNAFDCCGVGGPIELFVRDTCPEGNILQKITYSSCPIVIRNMFQSNAPLVLGGFLGTAGVMLLALVCSIILGKQTSTSRAPTYELLVSPDPLMYASSSVHQPV